MRGRIGGRRRDTRVLAGLLVATAVTLAGVLVLAGIGTSAPLAAGSALQFNGTSQYVRAGSVGSTSDALNASTFTLETWFYRTGTGVTTSTGTGGVSAAPLIAKGRSQADGSNVDLNYFLGINSSGRLVADFEEGAGQPSPGLNHPVTGVAVVTNNVWHHAAATYNGQTWALYLDGQLDRSLTLTSALLPRSDSIQRTALGSALNSSGTAAGFFKGRIDEARVWNVVRSSGQIGQGMSQELAGPQAGLLARFGLNEGSGTATDNAAGSPDGVLRRTGAGPTWAAGYAFGQPPDTTPPAVPTGLAATPGSGTVTLSWTANTESDLAGYNVYRGTSLLNATPVGGTSFTDTGLTNGTTYSYAVAAVDTSGNPSAQSTPPVGATPVGGAADPVLITAGDIASCSWTSDATTATLVEGIAGTVLTLGDNVYQNGTASEFSSCYGPTWGRFKSRTRPTPGNHDYNTAGASGYFDYFNGVGAQTGLAGDRSRGYYSFDVGGGAWHVIVLNSECETTTGLWLKGGCAAGSAQETWFKEELAAHATAATNNLIVTWHKPRFSSSTEHGNSTHMQNFWQLAYAGGVDLVLSGHSHNYERFTPLDAAGAADPTAFGMTTIVVGTGGATAHGFASPPATSLVRSSGTAGVLKLTLHPTSFDWQFVPVPGKTFTDAGTRAVHGPPA